MRSVDPRLDGRIRIHADGAIVLDESRVDLHRAWSATTHEILLDAAIRKSSAGIRRVLDISDGDFADADVRSGC
jgi:hypothetical protein